MGALRFAARHILQKIERTDWENQHLTLSIQVWRWKGFNPISTSIHATIIVRTFTAEPVTFLYWVEAFN